MGNLLLQVFAPKIEEALLVVRESGTAFEIHLSISDNPDQTVVICHISKSLSAEARAAQMAVLDLMRSMIGERRASALFLVFRGTYTRSARCAEFR